MIYLHVDPNMNDLPSLQPGLHYAARTVTDPEALLGRLKLITQNGLRHNMIDNQDEYRGTPDLIQGWFAGTEAITLRKHGINALRGHAGGRIIMLFEPRYTNLEGISRPVLGENGFSRSFREFITQFAMQSSMVVLPPPPSEKQQALYRAITAINRAPGLITRL